MKKRLIILIGSVFFLSGFTCIACIDGPYKGKVVDAVTGEPIEGVVVLAVWRKNNPTPAGGISKYNDARETLTDKNGDFEIQGKGLRVFSTLDVMITIFKAGYKYRDSLWVSLKRDNWKDGKALIPLRKLTVEERKRQGSPFPPTEAPLEKVKLFINEINKNEVELGRKPIKIWGGEKL
jgi:hypothetical protein